MSLSAKFFMSLNFKTREMIAWSYLEVSESFDCFFRTLFNQTVESFDQIEMQLRKFIE